MLRILLAGSDSRLLATRAAVLSKTGAAVVSRNPIEALKILDRDETFDLVVLCHTLEDCELDALDEIGWQMQQLAATTSQKLNQSHAME